MKKSSAGRTSVVKKKAAPVNKKTAPVAKKTAAAKKTVTVKKSAVVQKTAAAKKTATVKKTETAKKKTPPLVHSSPQVVKAPAVTEGKTASVDKHLTELEREGFKAKLLTLRARLRGDVITMADAALNKNRMESSGDLSTMPIHMADIGSDNFEQEQTLSFMQSEHGLLNRVEDALQRVKEGTYGLCEGCECRIPKARLNALPYAVKCVKCAAADEQF